MGDGLPETQTHLDSQVSIPSREEVRQEVPFAASPHDSNVFGKM